MSEKFTVEGGLSIPSGKNLEIAGVNLDSITTIASLSGNSTSAIPSEYSVKAYVDSQLGASDIDLSLDGNTQTSIDQSTGKLGFASTANEIEIAYAHDGTDGVFTIGLPNDVTIGNDLTVTNDLTVSGSIAGSADEMIISADGNEASASGGVAGTLTLNASAGIFTDADVDIDGTLDVAGTADFGGNLTVASGVSANFGGNVLIDGYIAKVGNIKPAANDAQKLGDQNYLWNALYVSDVHYANSSRHDFSQSVTSGGSVGTTMFTFSNQIYKSGKIVVQIEDSSGNVTATELLVVTDGSGNAKVVRYGTVSTGTEIDMTWTVSEAGNITSVAVLPGSSGTVKGHYELTKS